MIIRLGILLSLKAWLVLSEELTLSSKSKSTAECANSNGWVGPDQKYKCQSAKVNRQQKSCLDKKKLTQNLV